MSGCGNMDNKQKIVEAFMKFDSGDIDQSYLDIIELEGSFPTFSLDNQYRYLNTLGYIAVAKELFSTALDSYDKYLELAYKNKDNTEIHIGLHQTAMVYREMGDYNQALDYIIKERAIIDSDFPDDLLAISVNLYEEGYITLLMGGNIENSKKIMKNSLNFARLANDKTAIACSFRGLGEIYAKKEEFDKSLESFISAKKYFNEIGHQGAIQSINVLINNLPNQ